MNLTLDEDTAAALGRIADAGKEPRAAVARDLIQEGLQRREARAWRERLARDYAASVQVAPASLDDITLKWNLLVPNAVFDRYMRRGSLRAMRM